MDAEQLKKEINHESYVLRDLVCNLSDLAFELEYCPCCDEIHKELEKIKGLSTQMAVMIENMTCYKNMAEI
jgi:hypothetical protein